MHDKVRKVVLFGRIVRDDIWHEIGVSSFKEGLG
jgi:hypothetical protein